MNSTWKIWRWPLVLSLASLGGLISAVLADGWWDALSWLLLGGVIAVGGVFAAGFSIRGR